MHCSMVMETCLSAKTRRKLLQLQWIRLRNEASLFLSIAWKPSMSSHALLRTCIIVYLFKTLSHFVLLFLYFVFELLILKGVYWKPPLQYLLSWALFLMLLQYTFSFNYNIVLVSCIRIILSEFLALSGASKSKVSFYFNISAASGF